MSEKELQEYRIMFTEYWNIFKRYCAPDVDNTDVFWSDLVNDVCAAHDRFQLINDRLSYNIAIGINQGIQAIYDKKRQEAMFEGRQMDFFDMKNSDASRKEQE